MAQIKKKFLASNAVDGAKVQFSNNEAFRAKSSSGTDVELFKLDGSNVLQFLQMPRTSGDPVVGNDLSRKSYVDAQVMSEAAARVQADAAEQTAREAAIAAEQSARETADQGLQDAIDQEVSDRTSAVSSEASARQSADTTLQNNIDAEQSARETADSNLQDQIDALSAGNASSLGQEILDRQAGDSNLQSQLNTEKGRIDAILLAADADKDSFAEIVSLINSVDTTNDQAFASYVLSNDAALAQEISDRQAAVSAEQSARETAVSNEASARTSADNALGVRIDGVVSDLADEVSARSAADVTINGRIDQEISDRQTAVSNEQSDRIASDALLEEALNQEISDRQAAVSGEEAARMAADDGLLLELNTTQTGAGLGSDGSYSAPVGTQYLGSAVSLKDADSKLDAAIVAEVNARTTAVSNLEQSISDLDAAMTQGFDDAQAYTDSKVAALVDNAPALLDTLNELAAAIGDDENFASNIMTSIANEATARANADTAEANARSSADTTLQANIDAEESARISAISAEQTAREAADAAESDARVAELPRFAKVRMTLSSTDISNGYVDLDHVVLGSSTHVFIDRLACHEMDDYTLSTVGGKTRVTFSNGFMTSEEGPAAGDLFRCGYSYKNSDQ